MQQVEYGTIEQLRPVRIEGTKTPIGAGAGAAVGGIAGSSIHGGKTGQVMAVIGAVAGGPIGFIVGHPDHSQSHDRLAGYRSQWADGLNHHTITILAAHRHQGWPVVPQTR